MEHLNWDNLSLNTNDRVLDELEKNKDKINWDNLSKNTSPRAITLLEQNQNKINWDNLSIILTMMSILHEPPEIINRILILFQKNPDKFCWNQVAFERIMFLLGRDEFTKYQTQTEHYQTQTEHLLFQLLNSNPDKLDWDYLSLSPQNVAMDLLENNIERINWEKLSLNSCNRAVSLLLDFDKPVVLK